MIRCLLLFCGMAMSIAASAQKPVYRCEAAGRVSYSHAPCVGAKEVDTTPTQGLDKMSGKSRKGRDVQRHEHDGQKAQALKPLLGMTPEQYRVHHRRSRLKPADQNACTHLDADLPGLVQRAAHASGAERAAADLGLYQARKRFNDLDC